MILELISGFFVSVSMVNGIALILLIRNYFILAETSMEFAAVIIESIHEEGDGSIRVNALELAGISMDHLSHVSGLVTWIKQCR